MKRWKDFKTDSEFHKYFWDNYNNFTEEQLKVLEPEYEESLKNPRKVVSKQSEVSNSELLEFSEPKDRAEKEEQNATEERTIYKYSGRLMGFVVVPMELIYSGIFLSPTEKVLWLSLFRHDWKPEAKRWAVFPSIETLSIMMGVSRSTVKRAIKSLKDKGILKAVKRVNRTSLYAFKDPKLEWMEETKNQLIEAKKERLKRKEDQKQKQDEKVNEQLFS